MASNAKALAELNAKEAAGQGKFFGDLIQPIAGAVGKGAGSFFGGSGSSGSSWTPSDTALNSAIFPGFGTG